MMVALEQLQAIDGDVYLSDGDILLFRYPDGDCDTIRWPLTEPAHLASALFDCVECGQIDCNGYRVKLPNGMLFDIQEHLS